MAVWRFYLVSFLFICIGCLPKSCVSSERKDIPPEQQLYKYISTAVNVTRLEQRQELVDLTTGDLKSAIVGATEEAFKNAYLDKKYDFKSFEVLKREESAENPDQVLLDFKMVYKTWMPGEYPDNVPLQEVKNRATLVYEYGRWAVASVESLETSMNWENGLPTTVKETAP